MITYQKILKKPQVLNSLIGMSLVEFDELYAEFERAHVERESTLQFTRRHKSRRRRAIGAGRKYKYALCDRLLLTLFWLRSYTTYNVLATFYNLNKTTVEDYLKSVLQTLSTMATFTVERPQADIPKLRSVQEVIDAFPEVLDLLDSEDYEHTLSIN